MLVLSENIPSAPGRKLPSPCYFLPTKLFLIDENAVHFFASYVLPPEFRPKKSPVAH